MDASELGGRLRAERAANGRTIASVAADAGLSVPYIANLENGRGNPTLAALTRLAAALGHRLRVDLVPGEPAAPQPEPAGTVLRFARTARFRDVATRLAAHQGTPEQATRQRLLAVLTAAQAVAGADLTPADCHRLLDALVLTTVD
jgi:transcriptional regulator with XRE-family HTH domain